MDKIASLAEGTLFIAGVAAAGAASQAIAVAGSAASQPVLVAYATTHTRKCMHKHAAEAS